MFPLLKLFRALLIGVAELLEQMDGFNSWGLFGAELLQSGCLVPEFADCFNRQAPNCGVFSRAEQLDRALMQPIEPTHQFSVFVALHGAPLLIWGERSKTAQAAAFDQQEFTTKIEFSSRV